jgi:AbrB family looped-hinge helix DNA binding protein
LLPLQHKPPTGNLQVQLVSGNKAQARPCNAEAVPRPYVTTQPLHTINRRAKASLRGRHPDLGTSSTAMSQKPRASSEAPDRSSAHVLRYICITYLMEAIVRLNSKGQVTIPAELRHRYGLRGGDEVEVVEDGRTLRIVPVEGDLTRGRRLVRRMRGRASTKLSTDELMELLRGD